MKNNKFIFLIPLLGLIVVLAVVIPAFLNSSNKQQKNESSIREYKTQKVKYKISKSFENTVNNDLYKNISF